MSISEDPALLALIYEIATLDDQSLAFALFSDNLPLLKDYKFVFSAKTGGVPGHAVNRQFSAGGSVRSLFQTERVVVLDAETEKDKKAGNFNCPIDYSISMDTQAISYLEPYINEYSSSTIPKDFGEVFEFIARKDVYVDPLPYRFENLQNLHSQKNADRIYLKLRAYEVLRTLDISWFKKRGEIRSILSRSELDALAQNHISDMFYDLSNKPVMDGINFRHQVMYACLLQMAIIQLKAPKKTHASKVISFLAFCHEDLATIFEREVVIASKYFTLGQKLEFFGKVQKKKPEILEELSNMAWDLLHVRHLEERVTIMDTNQSRYFFSALLTFDKKLIEIMKLYPLKSCVFREGCSQPMPFYDGDWAGSVSKDAQSKKEVESFFSPEMRDSRTVRRSAAKEELYNLVKKMENSLRMISET